jgi:hypothetical protein
METGSADSRVLPERRREISRFKKLRDLEQHGGGSEVALDQARSLAQREQQFWNVYRLDCETRS